MLRGEVRFTSACSLLSFLRIVPSPLVLPTLNIQGAREGLDGRPRPVPYAHLWGNALTPIDGLASRPTRVE